MEKLKEISKKYILDDDFERLMEVLDKLEKSFKNEPVDVMKKHLIEIIKNENGQYIEFDSIEKVEIEDSKIIPYLEYVLKVYKSIAENPNCIIKPVVKIEPKYNFMEIVVDDIKIVVKNETVENIFLSIKNSNLIDCYSVYSSEEKYRKINTCDYCLSPDEFGFNIYNQFELPKEKQNFEVLAVPSNTAFVVAPEKVEELKNSKPDPEFVKQMEENASKININNFVDKGRVLKKTK